MIVCYYSGMDELFLLKLIKPQSSINFTQVQQISLPNNQNSFVTKMKLYGTGASAFIYIGTENNIYRVPVQSCSDYTTCFSCVQARDPYCGFNKSSLSCVIMNQSGDSSIFLKDMENRDAKMCSIFANTSFQISTMSGPELFNDASVNNGNIHMKGGKNMAIVTTFVV